MTDPKRATQVASTDAPAEVRLRVQDWGALDYLTGLGGEHSSEAIAGALPPEGNSPQAHPMGLYAEQINASSFTTARHERQRSWVYRVLPSVAAEAHWDRVSLPGLEEPAALAPPSPHRYRWLPNPGTDRDCDFVDGLKRIAQSGGSALMHGVALLSYEARRAMATRAFCNADAEMLVIPQLGRLRMRTELGAIDLQVGEIGLIPRGMKFSIDPCDSEIRGLVCENFGAPFRLPELGPIGANGLANPRHFEVACARFETDDANWRCVLKQAGRLWEGEQTRSPFDVVGWHGSWFPWRYRLKRFNAMNTVTYDHADPSIFTALTSPSGMPGVANADVCIFPPRWLVARDTFRPPYFHRNVMAEIVISIEGSPEARGRGYQAGSVSLHNPMSAHGPDPDIYERAASAHLTPVFEDTLMVMIESRLPFSVTEFGESAPHRSKGHEDAWSGITPRFVPPAR